MRVLKLLGWAGWPVALIAIAGCFVVLGELQDTRRDLRIETLRLPARPATVLPENWDAGAYRVLLVGDSRIERWNTRPTQDGVVFGISGIGGETTGELRDRFARDVLGSDVAPDSIVLAAGINDLVAASVQTQYVPAIHTEVLDLMIQNLKSLADQASSQGIQVRLATIVQPSEPDLTRRLLFWDDVIYSLVSAANDRISTLGYDVVDFNSALGGTESAISAQYALDTLHFNGAGYDALNDLLSTEFASE